MSWNYVHNKTLYFVLLRCTFIAMRIFQIKWIWIWINISQLKTTQRKYKVACWFVIKREPILIIIILSRQQKSSCWWERLWTPCSDRYPSGNSTTFWIKGIAYMLVRGKTKGCERKWLTTYNLLHLLLVYVSFDWWWVLQ